MTHQYVGAYYVPHGWYENYDPGFQYDPLSTVFYKNAWYILKQPAPVGTEPTNSKYWVQYSMVPGQIPVIQEQISGLEKRVDDLENITDLNSKNIVIITDSYGTGASTSDPLTIPFYKTSYFTDAGLINEQNVFANASNGSGVTTGKTWKTQVEEISVPSESSITDVIIVGGYNDFGTTINQGDYTNLYSTIKNRFPNASIRLFLCGRDCYDFNKNISLRRIYNQYAEYGAPFNVINCNASKILYLKEYFGSDYFHPNQSGQNQIAINLIQFLINGELTEPMKSGSFTISKSDQITSDIVLNYNIIGDSIYIYGQPNITFTSEIASGTSVKLGSARPPMGIIPTGGYLGMALNNNSPFPYFLTVNYDASAKAYNFIIQGFQATTRILNFNNTYEFKR